MTELEYKFKRDADAWLFAEERGVDRVIERHHKNKVEYIVKVKRYGTS